MPTGREIMEARLLKERRKELEEKFKKDKRYIIAVTTKFEGKFSHFEEENGTTFVVFTQDGRTDRGSVPQRRVRMSQIISHELIKT